MVIVETPVFTGRVLDILSDDEYRDLQAFLAANPAAGDIIPGSKGLRKLRWSIRGKAKPRRKPDYLLFGKTERYAAHVVFVLEE